VNNLTSSIKIKARLAILMSFLSVASTLIISVSVYYLWTEQIKNSVNIQLYLNAKRSVEEIEQRIIYEQQNLIAWSRLDIMTDILSNDTDLRIDSAISILKSNYQLAGEILVLDTEGKMIASTIKSKHYLFRFEQNHVNFHNKLTIEVPLIKNVYQEVLMTAPIVLEQLNNEPIGYVILTHPFSNILDMISKSLKSYELTDQLDYNRRITRNMNHSTQLDLNKNIETNLTSENADLLFTDWITLHINTKTIFKIRGVKLREEAFSTVYQTMRLIFQITFFMVVIIISIAVLASRRFVKPIIELQEFTEKIASSGQLDLEVPIHSQDEIGQLAILIQRMMRNLDNAFKNNESTNDKLMKLTSSLEERVTERTQELSSVIEQLKQTQSQLVQSEKMSSLGQLVAGIAHELNNPISAINTNIPILKEYFSDMADLIISLQEKKQVDLEQLNQLLDDIEFDYISEDIHALLKGQRDSAERIRDIILSLRNFSRLDEGELKRVDLQQGLDSTLNILRHEIKNRIELHRNYQLTDHVECFPGEINQVFMNILSNGCQAIEKEGNIWIETRTIDGTSAEIIIRDDGAGISEENIAKLFDPFFTTKPIGAGTGLGLSISYNIIEKHQGRINVSNALPHGAIFRIVLPLTQVSKNDQ